MSDKPRMAVIGCGYWGARHIRVGWESPCVDMALAVDMRQDRLDYIQATYRGLPVSRSFETVLDDSDINAVVVATPISTHYRLARAALEAGKHVLVEKPLATSSAECAELIATAEKRNRVLMVGHTFEYHPAVSFMRDMIRRGEMGELYYVDSRRLNLGLYQPDSNVLWDLAPHDLSIMFTLLAGSEPENIEAWGSSHIIPDVEDVVHARVTFDSGIAGHLHVSWLDPVKVRQVTIVGSEAMLVFDDVLQSEKVRVYDRRFKPTVRGDTYADFLTAYHHGDVRIPNISGAEPLKLELLDFAAAITTGKEPTANASSGLRVVTALEQASLSLDAGRQNAAAYGNSRQTFRGASVC